MFCVPREAHGVHSASHDPFSRKVFVDLRALTGLRFVAAFYVFLFHIHIRWPLTIVETIERAAAILGEAAIVRHPDDPFDDDLTDEYGPRLPQPDDCICYLDIEATAERAGYIASVAPHDPYHRWVLTKKPLPLELRALQWLARNAWVFLVILLSFMFYHFGVAMESSDTGFKGTSLPRWDFDVRFPHGRPEAPSAQPI